LPRPFSLLRGHRVYGTPEGVAALIPGAHTSNPSTLLPADTEVQAWIAEGASQVNVALATAGYVVPVENNEALVWPTLAALVNLYAAAYVMRARGLDTLLGETETRSEVWLRDFWNRLNGLVGAGSLVGVGVALIPAASVTAGGTRVRTLQMRRIDGYSAASGYGPGDTEYGVAEGVSD
jgi:hypothetical protein